MTRIVALANQKGGVGKTTTAINLGASLAACERKVLLIDLDPQSNATSGVGLSKDENLSIYPVLMDGVSLRSIIRPTALAMLFVAPSSVDLVGAEVELGSAEGREFHLRRAIEDVGSDYDYILIDSPPSLGLLTVNGLTAADGVLVPLQCEALSHRGVAQLLDTIADVREFTNPRLRVRGVIATMFDPRGRLAREVLEDVHTRFGLDVIEPPIPKTVRFAEAPGRGVSILEHAPNSAGAEAYRAIAAVLHDDLRTGAAA